MSAKNRILLLSKEYAQKAQFTPFFSLILLAIIIVLAVGVGAISISPSKIITALWHGITNNLSNTYDTIIWQIRLPRVLLAAFIGANLALSGVAFQGLFRNPLADPYLLGTASGAGFGAAFVISFGGTSVWLLHFGVPLAAFILALLTVMLVILLAKQGGQIPMVSLILAGVVVGSSFSAATSFVMMLARDQASNILTWMLGSFSLASWSKVATVTPVTVLTLLMLIAASYRLNILQLSEVQATQLGLKVETFKFILILVASFATAVAVSMVGIIGFVGLMIPHAVRLSIGVDYRRITPLAALWGALFMILADLLARTLIAPSELPVGVVTAVVGGPFFLYLLRRGQNLRS